MYMNVRELLKEFVKQASTGNLKTAQYPRELKGYTSKVSFGMGAPARIPWIALMAPDITVSNGYFPVYLYYKQLNTLILSFGISETNEFPEAWTWEVVSNYETIESFFGQKVPRYGNSYVYKAYAVGTNGILYRIDTDDNEPISESEIEADLDRVLNYYQEATNSEVSNPSSLVNQGAFYLEKQLEDFIIDNWDSTELGNQYDLIVEEGELKSQQYRTDIGQIDILAKDKKTGSYVVIELKKGQTSDDTVGQIARYMGWVEDELGDKSVKGVIIAQSFDKKLQYALKRVSGVEVFIYEINFRLKEFK